ncbi:hypothetical protein COY27_03610 [Candidatus Woesearchaeota archaeon CG_4_10_14_0_2_um_filter_33_13]|nr:MAG: hypothetical protein COY27_03610 [Candidatus Woesearchaeota archaeon CG_4_10_14_0_2_um_filter_33_13]
MDLDDCLRKGLIKKTRVDLELIQSLVEMAQIKEDAVNNAEINQINISAYVSLAYDALREALEAFCVKSGYKVLSHVCIGELLKKLVDNLYFEEFDRVRWIRNSINYYGQKVDFDQGTELIKKIFAIKKEILARLQSG